MQFVVASKSGYPDFRCSRG